jgi:hypothetical protein
MGDKSYEETQSVNKTFAKLRREGIASMTHTPTIRTSTTLSLGISKKIVSVFTVTVILLTRKKECLG